MLLAYVDESGNTGEVANRGSLTYTLGCVLVDAENWTSHFDEVVSMRRRVKDAFGVRMRDELKANYLLRNGGSIRSLNLAPPQRRLIYRAHLRCLADSQSRAFGVVVDKRTHARSPKEVFDLAWQTLLQRLERTSHYERQSVLIVHDEGEDDAVRKAARRARRYITAGSAFGTGQLVNRFPGLVDDPVSRNSEHSYFIQMADLVAYAAFRALIAPSDNIAAVCPQATWREIGTAINRNVNSMSGGEPGIVYRD